MGKLTLENKMHEILRVLAISLFFLIFFTSCSAPTTLPVATKPSLTPAKTPVPSKTPSPTFTYTPSPTETITPTPTSDPNADPDRDGYITYNEQIWGTDPFTFTSFEQLSTHPGTTYAKMRISQPYAIKPSDDPYAPYEIDLEELNSTIYQVVHPLEIYDNGTPDNSSDDHLMLEVVLFPYATHPRNSIVTHVAEFPIDSGIYPENLSSFLESTAISNITDEMRQTLLDLVKDEGSAFEAINGILRWNQRNIISFHWMDSTYYQIISYKAGDLFSQRKTRASTTWATLLTAELRAVGIPTVITFGVFVNPEANDCYCAHPQILAFLNNQWVRVDYNFGVDYKNSQFNPYDEFYYGNIMITDVYRDSSEANWAFWLYQERLDNSQRNYVELHESLEFRRNH